VNYLVLLLAYLIGAIPFGVIAAKICGVDIFEVGSGSTGATNVIRACGKTWGFSVLALDLLKGALATYLGIKFFAGNEWLIVTCAILAMIGHSYSIFIGFKGGKAAATGIGVLLALNWQIFLVVGVLVIIIRQTTGYQSLASIIPALVAPIIFYFAKQPTAYTILVIVGAVFVWLKHIPNIKRLLNGTESKIVKKKEKTKK
jgi:glycerol-3-phosphate acyltransferase PlsY